MEKYQLKNIDCASCAAKLEDGLSKLEEVEFVSINFASSSMTIDTKDFDSVKRKVKEMEPEVEIVTINDKKKVVSKGELSEHKDKIITIAAATVLLIAGLILEGRLHNSGYWWLEYVLFVSAYLISGGKVITGAFRNIVRGKVFDEQFLMTIATLGAFAIHEMAEGVAVMLFYVVGEFLQDLAVNRSRKSIKSLLKLKPDYANLVISNGGRDTEIKRVSPDEVQIGDTIVVKAGEKIPLDGEVTDGVSFVDTSALTGESVPRKVKETDNVLAGMINQVALLTIRVSKTFGESSISKILELVEDAAARKATTEKFITTFARYYTPVVVMAALLLAVLPPLLVPGATFHEWIYRALVVLVISCPCALVISIPLGYFGGIGRASRSGILVKGANYLDVLTKVKTVVFDKTGTLTKGEFKVSGVTTFNGVSGEQLTEYAALAEANSNHPIAKSIIEAYKKPIDHSRIGAVEEMPGHGVKSVVDGEEILIGNDKLLHKEHIDHPVCDVEGTGVHIVVNKKYGGYITISDNLKNDSVEAIRSLNKKGIKTLMLTGDDKSVAEMYAKKLGIRDYFYELLPKDKVLQIDKLIGRSPKEKVAFVGDGINDAPVLTRSDVGIAMGALGSDAAVETADVVLMTDSPYQVITAIGIANKTRSIVWQNIILALGIKAILIGLGIIGLATMWEAVFGDMGVALLAVFNAIRILK